MSYILDALKKSDQQRQRGAAPTLLTVQATATALERARFPLNGVIMAVLLCAGIAVGWLRPWQPDESVPARQAAATHPLAPRAPSAMLAPVAAQPHIIGTLDQGPAAPGPISSDQFARLPTVTSAHPKTPALAQGDPYAVTAPHVAVAPRAEIALPETKGLAGPADAGQGKRVMELNELPPSVQQEIPGISIAFHAYSSKPKDRRVMINGEMLVQGEQLASGLSLEEITPDGVVLAYKGYRFRRAVR